MAEHPNAAIARKAMEAFNDDPAAAADYLADDVLWWTIGSPQPLRGRQAVLDSMSGFGGVDWHAEIHDIVANDDHVVGLVEATVRVGDEEFTYRTAEIAHVEDGKITERWAFSDDTQRIVDFFSRFG